MSFSGYVKLKGCRWREVARAGGWGDCWTRTLSVRVMDDCERVVVPFRRLPGKGAVRMGVGLRELAEAVREMRTRQRLYFKERSIERLEESKRAERHVDDLVKAVLEPQEPGLSDQAKEG